MIDGGRLPLFFIIIVGDVALSISSSVTSNARSRYLLTSSRRLASHDDLCGNRGILSKQREDRRYDRNEVQIKGIHTVRME